MRGVGGEVPVEGALLGELTGQPREVAGDLVDLGEADERAGQGPLPLADRPDLPVEEGQTALAPSLEDAQDEQRHPADRHHGDER